MNRPIKPLPPQVRELIAAGEVIDRPAAIVKELLENALDAGATTITLEIQAGGIDGITITDNGVGMTADDLQLAWQRHTTSKLSTAEDLLTLSSFGFRGEALASIGAVSKMVITSRPHEELAGHQVTIVHGDALPLKPTSAAPGTRIHITQLFSQTPARKSFMGSARKEWIATKQVIDAFVLQHPSLEWIVRHNNKPIRYLGDSSEGILRTLVSDIQHAEDLIPIGIDTEYFQATGFVFHPRLAKTNQRHQWIFINGRWIEDTQLATVIKQGMGRLIPQRLKPGFLLSAIVPAGLTDCNIHPQKRAVSLVHRTEIMSSLQEAVADAITRHDITYQLPTQQLTWSVQDHEPAPELTHRKTHRPLHQTLQAIVDHWRVVDHSPPLFQVADTYIVASDDDYIIIIDQHAAHEAILFQEFSMSFAQLQQETSQLDTPVTVHLPAELLTLADEHQETLAALGVRYSRHDPVLTITHAPKLHSEHTVAVFVEELLSDLATDDLVQHIDSLSERTLAYLACRSAIMSGQRLSLEEMQQLVKKLAETDHVSSCPHGRPTHFSLSKPELDKLFHR